MSIGTDIWRVVYGFTLGSDGEIAQTGFHARWAHGAPADPATAALLSAHAASQWATAFGSIDNNFSSALTLDKVTVYHVVPGAATDNLAVTIVTGDDAWAGGNDDALPWECSLVMTLETTRDRLPHPRRYRGRMYLPALASAVLTSDGKGFIDSGSDPQFRDATLALLEGFNSSVDSVQARAVVYSVAGEMTNDVVWVSSDNKVDVQRRRENRQAGFVRSNSSDLDA